MIKKVSAKILNKYHLYKVPFLMGCLSYSVVQLLSYQSGSLTARTVRSVVVGTTGLAMCHYVGNYGMYKNVEQIFASLHSDSRVEQKSELALKARALDMELRPKKYS